jgi:hypothetical protein
MTTRCGFSRGRSRLAASESVAGPPLRNDDLLRTDELGFEFRLTLFEQ